MNRLLFILFITLTLASPVVAQTTTQTPTPRNPISVVAPVDVAALCGCEDKPLPAVLAVVNGVNVSPADISEPTRERVRQLQEEVVSARERELDLQINSLLLEAEAKKRGVNTAKVIEDEIVSKVTEPTEAEAQAFYDQNKERIQSPFADVKTQIVSYLREQRQRDLAAKLAERLRAAAAVKTNVEGHAARHARRPRARLRHRQRQEHHLRRHRRLPAPARLLRAGAGLRPAQARPRREDQRHTARSRGGQAQGHDRRAA